MSEPVRLKLRQDPDKQYILNGAKKKHRGMKYMLYVSVPALLLIGVVAGGVYLLQRKSPSKTDIAQHQPEPTPQGAVAGVEQHKEHSFTDENLDFSFRFKDSLTQEKLSADDQAAGFIARLTSENPPMIVSVRKESGLRLPASLAKLDSATLLKNNIDKSLPQRYPGFDAQTSTTVTVNGKSIIERVFTYVGPSGERAKQRMLAILKDEDTAIYISMQTTEQNYESTNTEFFEQIKTTVKF